MTSDLHSKPFSDETLVKLKLYKAYIQAWIRIILHASFSAQKNINIYDLFAGPGKDINGNYGSPIILLDELCEEKILDKARKRKRPIHIHFNEKDPDKFHSLENVLNKYRQRNLPYLITSSNEDFQILFPKEYPALNGAINLLFLDQSGVTHINDTIFNQITGIKNTDFIFFMASSYITRFKNTPEFAEMFSSIPLDEIVGENYYNVHREVLKYYKQRVDDSYYLCPFSIRKSPNIYGLIFGTHHPLGAFKFLQKTWGIDPERGEANFDIDNDNLSDPQGDMFKDRSQASKLTVFQNQLKNEILSNKFQSDTDLGIYCLRNGFLPKHAKPVMTALINEKRILPQNTLRYSESILKEPRMFEVTHSGD